jgi:copper transport protein
LLASAAIAGGLLAGGLALASPAAAHATVVSTDPPDGSRLRHAPVSVVITFDEPVGLGGIGYLHVTNEKGAAVDVGGAFHPGGSATKIADRLRPGLGAGAYTASFRVISADSHPVAGSIAFVVGSGALVHGNVAGSNAVNGVTAAADDVARWVGYAGLALLGGSWLLFTVFPSGRDVRASRRLIWTGWGALAVATVAQLALQGPYTAGLGISKLADTGLLDATLHTDFGATLCLRLLLLSALALIFERTLRAGARHGPLDGLLAPLGIGVIITFASIGHASTTSPAWLSMTLDGLHLLSMTVWLGGLVILLAAVLPRNEPDELRAVLPVFSTVAFGCVTMLALTGAYAAWRDVGTIHAVLATTYGLLVLAKIALFVGVLAVANLSRQHVQRRTVAYALTGDVAGAGAGGGPGDASDARDGDVHRELLRRSVLVEAVLAAVVLAVTAVLVAEPRGKEALAADYRHATSATAALGGGASVTVVVEPAIHGPVDITVDVQGRPHVSVTAQATQRSARIGPLPIRLTRTGAARFDGTATLSAPGRWVIDLVVSTSRFDATTADVTLTLH